MKYYIIPVTSLNQNCTLIWCKQTLEAAILDPGEETNILHQKITHFNIKVKKILLTHGHIDHVGAASKLSLYYNVPILGPNIMDKIVIQKLPDQCNFFKIKQINPFTPDIWLCDKEIINVGKISFIVLHCPGHSPGHIVFWNKLNKIILTGDIIFKGNVGRSNLPGGNKKDLINSIFKLFNLLTDDTIFLPGHGPISTIGYERHNNPFLIKNKN